MYRISILSTLVETDGEELWREQHHLRPLLRKADGRTDRLGGSRDL